MVTFWNLSEAFELIVAHFSLTQIICSRNGTILKRLYKSQEGTMIIFGRHGLENIVKEVSKSSGLTRPVILAFRKLRQEDSKFEARMCCTARLSQNKQTKNSAFYQIKNKGNESKLLFRSY